MSRISVAWECRHCGHRHLWRWHESDCFPTDIHMHCRKCRRETGGTLRWIGRLAMALVWREAA